MADYRTLYGADRAAAFGAGREPAKPFNYDEWLRGQPDSAQLIGSSSSSSSGAATVAVDGRTDKPVPLSRWYATVESTDGDIATVTLDDDSNGASTISVPMEVSTSAGRRVVVDFRPDGLAVVAAAI